MARELHFYIDDSGPRDPDRKPDRHRAHEDWFALGGVLINPDDKQSAEGRIDAFASQWRPSGGLVLRSYDIRNRTGRAQWLATLTESERSRFYVELGQLMVSLPIKVLACVIDRPGYNERYQKEYGPRRWKLCRSAFTIAVERAAKFAASEGARLRVFVERSDKPTEAQLKSYFDEMRRDGLPFDESRSAKYAPLSAENLREPHRVSRRPVGLSQTGLV